MASRSCRHGRRNRVLQAFRDFVDNSPVGQTGFAQHEAVSETGTEPLCCTTTQLFASAVSPLSGAPLAVLRVTWPPFAARRRTRMGAA